LGFIKKYILKSKNNPIVLTGHNLTDRIETSLLHMVRGAGVEGVQNMKTAELVKISTKMQYLVIRPLL